MNLLANGILPVPPEGLTEDDVFGVLEVLVKTRRAIPADEWVEEFIAEKHARSFEGLM